MVTMLRERGPRLANLGYFGHMWELYAFWTWLPVFLLRSQAQNSTSANALAFISFVSIGVAGVVGSLLGGWGADRFGRPSAAFVALVLSGACCLASPLLYAAPLPVLTAFLLVWGAAVIADSGVFSTALSEMADPRYVGTALTAQLAIGFLLTVLTIQFVPVLAEAVGWQYAFLLLVPGPVVGALSMWSLRNQEYNQSTQEVAL
jgi:MFS family permease